VGRWPRCHSVRLRPSTSSRCDRRRAGL
jgi:hypothetical protein